MPAPLFHNQYDKYSVHKKNKVKVQQLQQKGRALPTPRPRWALQYCSLLSVIVCSQTYGHSQLREGESLVPVIVKTLHGAGAGSRRPKYFTQVVVCQSE